MEPSFVTITPAKVDLLLVLMREFYAIEHLPFDESIIESSLATLFADESRGRVWLIGLDQETIGYVVLAFGFSIEFHGRDALIDEFYIREPYRGEGIGKRTLQFVFDFCASQNIRAVHLEVDWTNAYARALYIKTGFRDHERHLMTRWIET
jgi:GNAT superfamily N-acetyltransferase